MLVGSSKIREKVGMASPYIFENVTYNMRKYFQGETYSLDAEGRSLHASLKSFEATPDLAVLMLPPKLTNEAVETCAGRGVPAFIILTGGYKDSQRKQLLKLREEHDVRILGPNSIMGVLNTENGLNTTFERDFMPEKGGISVVSQSGGVGASILDWACFYKMGISKFAFVGDKIDVDDNALLQYFYDDKETKVVCLYIEGVGEGRKFIDTAYRVAGKKPVLALKGGKTLEAARRVKSHTASIAGSDIIFNAALKKARVLRVEDAEELLNHALTLAKQPPLNGDNIAIISNVGGPAIIAADAIIEEGLKLARLSGETKDRIEGLYKGVEASNPIDLIADAGGERYSNALNHVLQDPNVDGVMVITMLKSCYLKIGDVPIIVEAAKKNLHKPVVNVAPGGSDFFSIQREFRGSNIPVFNLPRKAAKALKTLWIYNNRKRQPKLVISS